MKPTIRFHQHSAPELSGLTPISLVSDRKIWTQLVTPITKSLLGDITSSQTQLLETEAGLFEGDAVSNLNKHQLYGGKTGFVRYPYLHSHYKTANGSLVIKRDAVKFEVFGWFGDVMKGRGELIYKVAMRDRRYDGTIRANDSALVDFAYDDQVLNKPLPGNPPSVEVSTYGFMPGSRMSDASGDKDLEDFVTKPYAFLDRPQLFLSLFQRAWATKRAPGQSGAPIPDLSQLIPQRLEKVARSQGYDFIEGAPSHYHVALWSLASGYRFSDPSQGQVIGDLQAGIAAIKAAGTQLNRIQESWIPVIQSLRPAELIPQGLYLQGPQWPQDNIGPRNLWMHKAISESAKTI